jgi:hypothetical protein
MKTPTNFIPIIGPLYADDLHNLDLYKEKYLNGDFKLNDIDK